MRDSGTVDHRFGRLVSVSCACPGVNVRDALRQVRGQERFYWQNRRDGYALAGFGITAELIAWGDRFDSIQRQARKLFSGAVIVNEGHPLAGPRLFGGFAFQGDFVPDNTWTIYTPAWFILPHYQLVEVGDEAWLTINVQIAAEDDPDAVIPGLREALAARCDELLSPVDLYDQSTPEPVDVNYPMSYAAWERIITDATDRIRAGDLRKVVLSRVAEVRFDENVNVDNALDHLSEHYADCYRFLFEPRPHHAFYGATPELLAQVEGRKLTTMALAGSIRRGHTPDEDAAYTREILSDPKNLHEHALVVEALRERLEPVTSQLDMPDTPDILKLSNIMHLYTPISATLTVDAGVLPVIEQLHPTPAMGGKPRAMALKYISEVEPVPRGWYAAPVGWIDFNLNGVFGVGIRSAVSQDKRVWLYAGAGIVGDSEPQKEWDETALKFRPMLDALGIRDRIQL